MDREELRTTETGRMALIVPINIVVDNGEGKCYNQRDEHKFGRWRTS